jgi:hypothetical protein
LIMPFPMPAGRDYPLRNRVHAEPGPRSNPEKISGMQQKVRPAQQVDIDRPAVGKRRNLCYRLSY